MSITINGFRFNLSTFDDISAHMDAWRTYVRKDAVTKAAQWLADDVTDTLDLAAVTGRAPVPENPLAKAGERWDEMQKDIRLNRRHPEVDYEFVVHVYPWRGSFYGVVVTEQRDWREKFKAEPWVQEFSWWSDSEPRRPVPKSRWRRREKVWRGIFDDFRSRPSFGDVGCTFRLHVDWPLTARPSWRQVLAEIPSYEDRLDRIALSEARDQKWKELAKASGLGEDGPPRDMIRLVIQAQGWSHTEEARPTIAQKREEASRVLAPEITPAMLLGWDPEE